MDQDLQIISSCTDGKRGIVPKMLRLRAHRAPELERRFEKWWAALQQQGDDANLVPAADLYIGDHWAVTRELPALAQAQGWQPRLWALSAGYGLIPASAGLRPYAATFGPRHADSISRLSGAQHVAQQKLWWSLLCKSLGPDKTARRSVSALVHRWPESIVLLIASPQYLRAVEDDLVAAMSEFRGQGGLVIVSSFVSGLRPELAASCVQSNARFQFLVQGSLLSLHARVARWLIQTSEQHRFCMPKIRRQVEKFLRTAPPSRRYDRIPVTDEKVREFIRRHTLTDPTASHTRLLREWRNSGQACEQGRFRNIFLEVQGTLP